jgi:L-lactate dehydrogenase complex protein LldF
MAQAIPEWERLRETAAQIKAHTASRLADYLEEFERNAQRLGAQVHWARNAAEHNEIVLGSSSGTARGRWSRANRCSPRSAISIRSSSGTASRWSTPTWASGSCSYAASRPAISCCRRSTSRRKKSASCSTNTWGLKRGYRSRYLTEAARGNLREKFLGRGGITGVNFAIAETGGIVVCTNEGNADLGVSLPKLHIACMGIEKLIPRAEDLGVFCGSWPARRPGSRSRRTRRTFTARRRGRTAHRAGRQRPQRSFWEARSSAAR